ncbi:MAG: glycosyltransferase family 4 protein [Pseudomonadota bacterium]
MKILLSAFSFGPGQGSEPGIGWNWALHAARQGHAVTVVTSSEYRDDIAAAASRGDIQPGVTIDIFMPDWLERAAKRLLRLLPEGLAWNLIHVMWQRALVGHVQAAYAGADFDFAHHITLGGARHPTVLHKAGIPLVVGPLGGGDRVPMALRKSFPMHGWLSDLARDVYNRAIAFDPMTRGAAHASLAYYARTEATRRLLPGPLGEKTRVRLELGIDQQPAGARPEPPVATPGRPLRLVYAGRLTYLKGMHLGIRAIAAAVESGADLRLTMAGDGREEQAWRGLAEDLGIADRITWLGRVSQGDLAEQYRAADALLFPSLRDASGNVVVEAMSHARPVICLALGGPNEIVTPDSGIAVPVAGRSEADVVRDLGGTLAALASDRARLAQLGRGALARTNVFHWPNVVHDLYQEVQGDLARRNPTPAAETGHAPDGHGTSDIQPTAVVS